MTLIFRTPHQQKQLQIFKFVITSAAKNQSFYTTDMVLSNLIERLQTCTSMASLRHQRTSIRLWSALMT